MAIARVIADPDHLSRTFDDALRALAAEGLPVALAQMLNDEGTVLEFSFPDGSPQRLHAALAEKFAPCDVLVGADTLAAPHLFVSDMDSTIIGQECIDELADYAGLKEKISAITERAMQGELDFEAALRERVALLEGLEEQAIADCLAERIEPMAGARELVATLKHKSAHCVLVTGGFHHFADPIGEMLGFDRVVGNRLGVADGKLTGKLVGPVVDSSVKRKVLEEERERLGEGALVLATGDGANDIPMIEAADYGVAYHAKPKAREAANGSIGAGDLTSVLTLLGIDHSEWVAA